MATKKNTYENGKIVKVVDSGYNKCYYTSTIQPLGVRMCGIRSKYKKFKAGEGPKFAVFDIFDKYGIDNCNIELVEYYPCTSKDELEAREGYYIQHNICVNKELDCPCGSKYTKKHQARHEQSKKHIAWLNSVRPDGADGSTKV